jgi:hypothetical protein
MDFVSNQAMFPVVRICRYSGDLARLDPLHSLSGPGILLG